MRLDDNCIFFEKIIIIIAIFVSSIIVSLFIFQIDDVIKCTGYIRTENNISTVICPIDGKIEKKLYKNGQEISSTETLFILDTADYKEQNIFYNQQLNIYNDLLKQENNVFNAINKNINYNSFDLSTITRIKSYYTELEKLELIANQQKSIYSRELKLPSGMTSIAELEELKFNYEKTVLDLNSYKSTYLQNLLNNIKTIESNIYDIKTKISEIEHKIILSTIKAPISGIIEEISFLNEQDFIQNGQIILKIIPINSSNLVAKLAISPKNIGKIELNQEVKMRLTAFPYYEFGGLKGNVILINPDINFSNSSPYFFITCSLDKIFLYDKNKKQYGIKPGYELDARIILKRKAIIEFIFEKIELLIK